MRTKKLLLNSISLLGLQLVTLICGFILPRQMLQSFGSEINGAVSSITQFLGYISLIEAGAGGVTRAALYKPLADRNALKINAIVNAAQDFFRKIAYIFVGYACILSCTFKYISNTGLEWIFTFSLVWILAISTFVQYYFGITFSILLKADQMEYISSSLQICSVILNTLISVILLKLGCGVHIVKLVSAGVYILRPIALNIIVKRKYKMDKAVIADNDAIKQRWSGFGQHIAYYIQNNVDSMVVTMMLGLKWSSVYSIYHMILVGIRGIVVSMISGSEASFGNMIAKEEEKILNDRFHIIETLSSMIVIVFFTVTGLLLIDFLRIYTNGIEDINYLILPFGILFAISEALHCIKQNYHNIVWAAGQYKETQRGAFIEAGLNLVLSIVSAGFIGISGILFATIISNIYRIFDYICYLNQHILYRRKWVFFRHQIINICNVISIVIICLMIPFSVPDSYIKWILKAVPIFVIAVAVTFIYNLIFYREDVTNIGLKLKGVFHERFSTSKKGTL